MTTKRQSCESQSDDGDDAPFKEFPHKIIFCDSSAKPTARLAICSVQFVKGRQTGVFQTGGFPIWTCPSFFVLFCPFWDFPDCSGFSRFARGWSGDFPDLSFSSFSAYQEHLRGTVPKGSATQSGPFPRKVGNTRVWKHPGLASLKFCDEKWPNLLLAAEIPCDFVCDSKNR